MVMIHAVNTCTYNYLLPVLGSYSQEFIKRYNTVHKFIVGCGVSDVEYNAAKKKVFDKHLFLVFDTFGEYDEVKKSYKNPRYYSNQFDEFLKYARNYTHYVDDYYFNGIMSPLHCIVFNVPVKYQGAVKHLKDSKYSLMYSDEDLRNLKIKVNDKTGRKSKKYGVLKKTPEYKLIFEEKLNELFNTNIKIEDDRELEFPFKEEFEILNYERINEL